MEQRTDLSVRNKHDIMKHMQSDALKALYIMGTGVSYILIIFIIDSLSECPTIIVYNEVAENCFV